MIWILIVPQKLQLNVNETLTGRAPDMTHVPDASYASDYRPNGAQKESEIDCVAVTFG